MKKVASPRVWSRWNEMVSACAVGDSERDIADGREKKMPWNKEDERKEHPPAA
jgi:hypothetical protein